MGGQGWQMIEPVDGFHPSQVRIRDDAVYFPQCIASNGICLHTYGHVSDKAHLKYDQNSSQALHCVKHTIIFSSVCVHFENMTLKSH